VPRIELPTLVDPAHTAVLTMELQRGIVGDLAPFTALAECCAERNVLENAGRLCDLARAAGVRVVHCTAENRADGAGGAQNCQMLAASARFRDAEGRRNLQEGSPSAELIPELAGHPEDIVIPRLTGMTPFTATSLDQILRNLGVTTVVAAGVSVNVGVFGMAISACDLGYQTVVVRDAVAGVPVEYGDTVLANSIPVLATVVSVDDLAGAWAGVAAVGS
jgi:nicotinamidase-related amidase